MAEEVRFEHRMSDSDALLWNIEKDPILRSTITAVALLDRAPDHGRLEEKIDRGTRLIPRMRQKVMSPPLSAAPPRWVVDPDFDLRYHVRYVRAGGDGSMRDLLDLVQPIAMQSFDRARPLWEFVVVEGLADGRAALVQKIHHAVTDGVGGMKLAMMLLDLERDLVDDAAPMPEAPEPERPGGLELWLEGVAHERRRQLGIARRMTGTTARAVRGIVSDPMGSARGLATDASSLGRLLAPVFEPASPIMRARSLRRHLDTITVPLGEMKAAARPADGKLNDSFVAAVAGGLRAYHEHHGAPVEALRMTMPINIRSGPNDDLAGNQFTPARFLVPVGIDDPKERLTAVRRLSRSQQDEPALAFTEALAGVLNRLPTYATTALFGSMLKGVDFVTSNVQGAPMPVFLAGGRLEANYAFGPLSGAATNLTLLSYCDDLHIGVNIDLAAIPDPDVFMGCLHEGFDEIRKLA